MNASRLKKTKGNDQVNILGNLLKCYEEVPNQYFEEKFIFNFKYLTQDKARVLSVQDQVNSCIFIILIV